MKELIRGTWKQVKRDALLYWDYFLQALLLGSYRVVAIEAQQTQVPMHRPNEIRLPEPPARRRGWREDSTNELGWIVSVWPLTDWRSTPPVNLRSSYIHETDALNDAAHAVAQLWNKTVEEVATWAKPYNSSNTNVDEVSEFRRKKGLSV